MTGLGVHSGVRRASLRLAALAVMLVAAFGSVGSETDSLAAARRR